MNKFEGGTMELVFFMFLASFIVFLIAIPWILFLLLPIFFVFNMLLFPMTMWLIKASMRLKVLVVDDDEVSVTPLLHAIKQSPFPTKVYFVESGWLALKSLELKKYDLLIIDYLMPDYNGDQVLKMAEIDTRVVKSTPVVFYTSNKHDLEKNIEDRYQKFLVQDVWGKSLSFDLLSKKITKTLSSVA